MYYRRLAISWVQHTKIYAAKKRVIEMNQKMGKNKLLKSKNLIRMLLLSWRKLIIFKDCTPYTAIQKQIIAEPAEIQVGLFYNNSLANKITIQTQLCIFISDPLLY